MLSKPYLSLRCRPTRPLSQSCCALWISSSLGFRARACGRVSRTTEANKAAELVGLAMGVCVWLPDLTTIANNAMKGLVAADQMAGIATDFVRDIMNWVEGLVPESVITKMAQVNNFFDVIMTPTRGFKVALFDSHKVCICVVEYVTVFNMFWVTIIPCRISKALTFKLSSAS